MQNHNGNVTAVLLARGFAALGSDCRRYAGNVRQSDRHAHEAVINYATGDERISAFAKHFAKMGAPWTFGIDDLNALAGDAGLTVIDDLKTAELFRTFWPNRQLDSKWYDDYALCTLAGP